MLLMADLLFLQVHFADDQWQIIDGERILKEGAVPTLFSHNSLETETSPKRMRLSTEAEPTLIDHDYCPVPLDKDALIEN